MDKLESLARTLEMIADTAERAFHLADLLNNTETQILHDGGTKELLAGSDVCIMIKALESYAKSLIDMDCAAHEIAAFESPLG